MTMQDRPFEMRDHSAFPALKRWLAELGVTAFDYSSRPIIWVNRNGEPRGCIVVRDDSLWQPTISLLFGIKKTNSRRRA